MLFFIYHDNGCHNASQLLNRYLNYFQKLRRDQKNGGAPHKPILLLGLIHMFAIQELKSNKIPVSAELLSYFKTLWSQLVTSQHHPNFALPFYHMKSEPFWHLVPNAGYESWMGARNSIRSINNLQEAIAYAEIDPDLAYLLSDEDTRQLLYVALLDTYFPQKKGILAHRYSENGLLEEITSQILYEPGESYRQKVSALKKVLDQQQFEEEVFLRKSIFKREIPKLYNYSCCISEMRLDTLTNISMVDACHIVPFSESYDDTLANGFSLCPNLHRAFDRGIISIGNEYEVLVSSSFTENTQSTYSIRQLEGKKILLPEDKRFYPSQENFAIHRNRYGYS